jgi:hypothetical protein
VAESQSRHFVEMDYIGNLLANVLSERVVILGFVRIFRFLLNGVNKL